MTYPLHPNQTHASPPYATVPVEEYEKLKRKLDETQRETIRIAELYRRDREAFNKEICRLTNLTNTDPEYTQALGDLAISNARLKDENARLKDLNAQLQERVTRLEHACDVHGIIVPKTPLEFITDSQTKEQG